MWNTLKPFVFEIVAIILAAISAYLGAELKDNPQATTVHWMQVPGLALLACGSVGAGIYVRRKKETKDKEAFVQPSALQAISVLHKEFSDSPQDLKNVQTLSFSLMARTFPAGDVEEQRRVR